MRNTADDPVVVHLPCAYCGAGRGQRCQSHPSERTASYLHEARSRAARDIADALGLSQAWDESMTAYRRMRALAKSVDEVVARMSRGGEIRDSMTNTLRRAVQEARS